MTVTRKKLMRKIVEQWEFGEFITCYAEWWYSAGVCVYCLRAYMGDAQII
jgi:hypothetical protein